MAKPVVAAVGGSVTLPADASIRELGAPVGLQLAEITIRLQKLFALRGIRENKSYRVAGHNWDSYCREVMGVSSNSVEEELANLEALGEQLYTAGQLAGITRGDYRVLRALPSEELPKLLPSGEIQIGDRAIPVDADHKNDLTEALRLLVSELAYARNTREDAEAALSEARETIREREGAIEKLGTQLASKREAEQEVRRFQELRDAATGDVMHGILLVAGVLAQLKERCEQENPDRDGVLRAARVLIPLAQALINYGAGRRMLEELAPDLDPDELDRVLAEQATEEAELDGEDVSAHAEDGE